jgi:hypothetical protein
MPSERLLICEDCGRTCARHLPAVRCVRCGGRLHVVPMSPLELEEEFLRAQYQLIQLQRAMVALLSLLKSQDLIAPSGLRDVMRYLEPIDLSEVRDDIRR